MINNSPNRIKIIIIIIRLEYKNINLDQISQKKKNCTNRDLRKRDKK